MKTNFTQGLIVTLAVSGAFAVSLNSAESVESSINRSSRQTWVSDAAVPVAAFEVSRAKATTRATRSRSFIDKRDQLTDIELKDLLYSVGFRGQNLKEAWCIAKRESNGRPMAHNQNSSTGDNSYGIFQINMIGSLGPARRDQFNLESNDDLFNPIRNAEIAYYMSHHGDNWDSWHGMNSAAKKWLDNYPM